MAPKGLLNNSLNTSVAVRAETRNHLLLRGEKHYLALSDFGFIVVHALSSYSDL